MDSDGLGQGPRNVSFNRSPLTILVHTGSKARPGIQDSQTSVTLGPGPPQAVTISRPSRSYLRVWALPEAQMPRAGITPTREPAASQAGHREGRARNTAEPSQTRGNVHSITGASARARGRPTFLPRPGAGGRQPGLGEGRKVVCFHALPSSSPPSSRLSSRDLVRTPWPERSPSRPPLGHRSAPRSPEPAPAPYADHSSLPHPSVFPFSHESIDKRLLHLAGSCILSPDRASSPRVFGPPASLHHEVRPDPRQLDTELAPFIPGLAPRAAPRPPTLPRRSRPGHGRPHFLPHHGRASPARKTAPHWTYKEPQALSHFNWLRTPRPREPSGRLLLAPPTAGPSQSEARSRHSGAGAGRVAACLSAVGGAARSGSRIGWGDARRLPDPGSRVDLTSEVRGRRPGFAIGCSGRRLASGSVALRCLSSFSSGAAEASNVNAVSRVRAGWGWGCGVPTAASPWEAAGEVGERGPALWGADGRGDGALEPFHSSRGCPSRTRAVAPPCGTIHGVYTAFWGAALSDPHRVAGAGTSTWIRGGFFEEGSGRGPL